MTGRGSFGAWDQRMDENPSSMKIRGFWGLDQESGCENRRPADRKQVGIKGLLVTDERGDSVVYLLHEPSSDYYRVMTGSDRMPVLVKQGY